MKYQLVFSRQRNERNNYERGNPSENMLLIDLHVETAAGDQNHCALVGNYFIRTSTSINDKRETAGAGRGERHTERAKQTDRHR